MKFRSYLSITFLVFLIFGIKSPAEALNDFTTWAYKVKINVNNPTGTNVTDYPVRINVPAKVYIDAAKMNSDMRDIRFADSNGYPLPFWIHVTESMIRQFNNIPVYVKLKTFNSGDNIIYMYFDSTKSKTTNSPQSNYTTSSSTYCGDGGSSPAAAPYTNEACGENTFGGTTSFSFDCTNTSAWTADSSCKGYTNKKWVSKSQFGTSTDNVGVHFRTHFYSNKGSMYMYFMTQSTTAPTTSNLVYYCGYRLWYEHVSTSTADDTYNMNNNKLHVQYKSTNCGTSSTGWADVTGSPFTNWQPYNNSIQDFDVLATSSKIDVKVNGNLIGTVNRSDSITGGYVGFDRGGWNQGAEGGSNSTDGISPIWITNNYLGAEPVVTFLGNTDLLIERVKPTVDASYIGQNVIEYTPKAQILEDYVDGDTLDKYVYNNFPIASPSSQIFKQKLKITNRGASSDTFDIILALTGDASQWSIGYEYGTGMKKVLPGTGATNTAGSVTLAGGASQEITITVVPSPNALFEGAFGRLVMDFAANSRTDYSFDNVRFLANVNGKTGCYWQWKLPITISYGDTYGTGNLVDHQVQVNLSGMDFSDSRSDGADIIFTDALGTALPFWTKSFNRAGGTASYWVKVHNLNSGSTTIYMWWGNSNYSPTRSNRRHTFDLWEDWETGYSSGITAGCPDGTSYCTSQPTDPDGWRNNPIDSKNWWKIRSRLDGNAVMADIGSTNTTPTDIGPMLAGGDVRWKSYEVSYSFYDEYTNYSGSPNGNPLYNPVYFQDLGNGWGMESFANMFIFRPFGFGTDWTWTYQANVSSKLGGWTYPYKNTRYWIKVRLFQNPTDGLTHLKLFISPKNSSASDPSDTDSDTDFVQITPTTGANGGGFISDPAFNIQGGMVGFGGWYGGFSFDNIRVRKYAEPEPTCSSGTVGLTSYSPIQTLSMPVLTSPLLNGRSVLLTGLMRTFSWIGDVNAVYADCYIAGDCQTDEDPAHLGTISLWGNIDSDTPRGFGNQLELSVAGDNNRASINDDNWQSDGRYLFTAYDSNSDSKISCTTTAADCIAFGTTNASILKSLVGYSSEASPFTQTSNLVKFVRGEYVSGFARSDIKNMCTSGTADTCQWKLGDIAHSNPLVIAVPNMLYADSAYSTFRSTYDSRDMVVYFSSNEGVLHAVRMAKFNTTTKKYEVDTTATELWGFIPNAVLPLLNKTTDSWHEYTADGLLRAIDIKSGGTYKTVLVGGLRGGGESIFAIDVTDPRTPQLMWEINPTTSSTYATAFEKIGKSWSAPALGRLCETTPCDSTSTTNRWVAIVGSGLLPNDIDNLSKTAYLSIINLETGEIIKQIQVSTKPGNITTNIGVLRDRYGYIQKIYFGDYYGAVWRANLASTANVATILDSGKTVLGDAEMLFKPSDYAAFNITTNPPTRTITSQPVIAYSRDVSGNDLWWTYFGTGVYDVYNASYPYQRFYGLKDNVSSPYVDADLTEMTYTSATNSAKNSWFLELGHTDSRDYQFDGTSNTSCVSSCESSGFSSDYCDSTCKNVVSSTKDQNERLLSSATVYGGFVFFSTFTPANSACGGGVARFYGLGFDSGSYNGGLMMLGNVTDARSIAITTSGGVPSTPLVYSGKSGGGQIVAAGLVDVSTSGLTKTPLNPEKFKLNLNLLLWRKIR